MSLHLPLGILYLLTSPGDRSDLSIWSEWMLVIRPKINIADPEINTKIMIMIEIVI